MAPEPEPHASFTRARACRYGRMIYPAGDAYVGRSLELYGEFSEAEVDVFRQLVRPGDWVVDAGANLGAHTLAFARLVGPGGRVYAFEPQRILFQLLCANLAGNGVTNAWCYPQAVGAATGTAVVPPLDYAAGHNFGGVALAPADAVGEPTPVVPLDGLDLQRCDFLKVDVEGMEAAVLRGAARTIARCRPILYVENDRPDRSADLITLLADLGYEPFGHFPPLFNPGNFFGNPDNVFGRIVSGNVLAIPRGAKIHLDGFPRVPIPDRG